MAESGLKYMNKDLRNVVITFSLIALVFTGSSFVYAKNQEKEYLLELHQSDLERLEEEKAELMEQNRELAESLKRYQSELEIVKKNLALQIASRNIQNQRTVAQVPFTPTPTPTPTPVITPVKTSTLVKKTVVVKPSRKSRAS